MIAYIYGVPKLSSQCAPGERQQERSHSAGKVIYQTFRSGLEKHLTPLVRGEVTGSKRMHK